MKMMHKKIALIAVLVLSFVVLLSGSAVYAQTPTVKPSGLQFFQNIIDVISQKLGFKKNDVKKTREAKREQRLTEMQKKREDRDLKRLDTLVKEGTITEDQKKALIAEFKKLKAKYGAIDQDAKTPVDRKARFEAMRRELEAWVKDAGIDASILKSGPVRGLMMGMRGRLSAPGQQSR